MSPGLNSQGIVWCFLEHGHYAGQALSKALGDSFAAWLLARQMASHCFKVSVQKIQAGRVNLHFKTALFEVNYITNEKPVWSSGFSVRFGRTRSLF